ncbi:hypothetical protein BGZ67_007908 [Mortierella alpina]|nr:hypothetical protein BGZ67_007908 [Mortierella alpina]
MEQWSDGANASEPLLAADSDTRDRASIAQPHPPVLSFRTFHSRHFSGAQRQAFFGASAPVPFWFPHPLWSQTRPVEEDTVGHPGYDEESTSGYVEVDQAHEQAEYNDATHEGRSALDQDEPPALQLSKEAIEIFEFSRRFKREKAEAALREQTRIKRRRAKRRRLTKLGLASDEGNSGSEGGDDETHLCGRDAVGGNGVAQRNELNVDSDEEAEEEEEDDLQETAEQEAPALDTSFLHQRSRQRERTRLQLYGHVAGSAVEGGIARIDVLEAMLNETYEESLGSRATEDAGLAGRKRKGRGSQAHAVYWPGVPLRC